MYWIVQGLSPIWKNILADADLERSTPLNFGVLLCIAKSWKLIESFKELYLCSQSYSYNAVFKSASLIMHLPFFYSMRQPCGSLEHHPDIFCNGMGQLTVPYLISTVFCRFVCDLVDMFVQQSQYWLASAVNRNTKFLHRQPSFYVMGSAALKDLAVPGDSFEGTVFLMCLRLSLSKVHKYTQYKVQTLSSTRLKNSPNQLSPPWCITQLYKCKTENL